MKNQKTTARTPFLKLALAGFIAAASFTSAQAQNSTAGSPSPQIKYVGSMGDKLVFQVDFDNTSEEGFSLEIGDEQGYQFYFDRFKDKSFKKKFAIDKTELGENAIKFTVATKEGIRQQVFGVNNSYTVEEVSIAKL